MSAAWLEDLVQTPIALGPEERPMLQVVVDTEEEFDWEGNFDRQATSVDAMDSVGRAQVIFDEFGLRPTYVVDYPVASQEKGYTPIKEIVDGGRGDVGAHLHPWVSPPFDEELCARNSFAGNLPAELEAAKLDRLVEQIATSFGRRPVIYKAGRYGLGPNSVGILEGAGFEVDLSFCPGFDFTADGGPDYSQVTSEPRWLGNSRGLLELPTTGAFVGSFRRWALRLNRLASRQQLRWAHLPGILSRLGLLDRLLLSPEGFDLSEMRRLTRHLLSRGVRVFNLSFHSPSLEPGCTPYVRNESDLQTLLDSLRHYFDYFLGELNGRSMTPLEIKRYLESSAVGDSS
jgi:hypothetical protein